MVEHYFGSLGENKWVLSTGTVVEDVMKQYASTCQFEHPVHSLILDVDDTMWIDDGYFTEEEMKEVKNEACPKDYDLPEKLNEYLKGYLGKRDLETIFEQASHVPFHPKNEPDLFWIHQTFLKTLNLFYNNYLPVTDHSESDLLNRVWVVVQECFDESEFKVRGGEGTSGASTQAKNASHSLSREEMISRRATDRKVDLLFKSGLSEYACAEAGKQLEVDTTKELVETKFICPKTLRDMLVKLGELQPKKLHELVLVGFIFSGMYLHHGKPLGHLGHLGNRFLSQRRYFLL
ncbi:hypothetical protein BDC45DRAFT_341073 [Circinella umbellata]|nr:hypothetical protein BDC45DRAFT_341073 [Circinella umbellata]